MFILTHSDLAALCYRMFGRREVQSECSTGFVTWSEWHATFSDVLDVIMGILTSNEVSPITFYALLSIVGHVVVVNAKEERCGKTVLWLTCHSRTAGKLRDRLMYHIVARPQLTADAKLSRLCAETIVGLTATKRRRTVSKNVRKLE